MCVFRSTFPLLGFECLAESSTLQDGWSFVYFSSLLLILLMAACWKWISTMGISSSRSSAVLFVVLLLLSFSNSSSSNEPQEPAHRLRGITQSASLSPPSSPTMFKEVLSKSMSSATATTILCHLLEVQVEYLDAVNSISEDNSTIGSNISSARRDNQELVCETTVPMKIKMETMSSEVAVERGLDTNATTTAALWVYRINNIPEHMRDTLLADDAVSGTAWVRFTDVIISDQEASIDLLPNTGMRVVTQPPNIVSLLGARPSRPLSSSRAARQINGTQYERHLSSAYQNMGKNKVLVIRVSYLDYYPNVTADEMRGKIFGVGPKAQRVNLRRQIRDCSFGKLRLQPAYSIASRHRSNTSAPISQGVTEMNITVPISTNSTDSARILESVVAQTLHDWYGADYLVNKVNQVILIFPNAPGVLKFRGRNYLAYAFLRGKWAIFNNHWGVSLSALAHELGHNWNLNHAGEGTSAYGDTTGSLGFGALGSYPRSCYNAQKNWYLQWYEDRALALTAASNATSPPLPTESLPWTGYLAAFVDYKHTSMDQPVLLQIQSDRQDRRLYCQYNRATKFNRGTREYRNQVVIVLEEGSMQATFGIQSWLVGSIMPPPVRTRSTPGQSISNSTNFRTDGRALLIQICNQTRGQVDFVGISVYLEGQVSGCLHDNDQSKGKSPGPTELPSRSFTTSIIPTKSSAPSLVPFTTPSLSDAPSIRPAPSPSASPNGWAVVPSGR